MRDRLVEHRQKEKASYGGLFDKGPMYNDKEVSDRRSNDAVVRSTEELERLERCVEVGGLCVFAAGVADSYRYDALFYCVPAVPLSTAAFKVVVYGAVCCQVERQKREAEAAKRLKEEEEQWGKVNEQRKAEGKEEQTLEDWRKEKKGACHFHGTNASLCRLFGFVWRSVQCLKCFIPLLLVAIF